MVQHQRPGRAESGVDREEGIERGLLEGGRVVRIGGNDDGGNLHVDIVAPCAADAAETVAGDAGRGVVHRPEAVAAPGTGVAGLPLAEEQLAADSQGRGAVAVPGAIGREPGGFLRQGGPGIPALVARHRSESGQSESDRQRQPPLPCAHRVSPPGLRRDC